MNYITAHIEAEKNVLTLFTITIPNYFFMIVSPIKGSYKKGNVVNRKLLAYSTVLLLIVARIYSNQPTQYTSQVGQDQYVHEHFFYNKKSGCFVDIGAHDGQSFSNSYFFEKQLGWQGICFEPLPHLFEKLTSCRNCLCINACVSNTQGIVPFIHVDGCDEMLSGIAATFDKRHLQIVLRDTATYGGSCKVLQLPTVKLSTILDEQAIRVIDFLSLDTEGNELEILRSIDFNYFLISVICVENNYGNEDIRQFLQSQGYTFVTRLHVDDVFYRPDLITYY